MAAEYHLLRFEGFLDIGRYPEFREAFLGAPADVPVLVDLNAVEGADSVFLSELLLFKRRHREPVAVVLPPTGQLRRIFGLASVGEKMDVYDDITKAITSLGLEAPKPEKTQPPEEDRRDPEPA